MTRVAIVPEMFSWARQRAGLEVEDLVATFAKLPEWERGDRQPTLKQVEKFARAVHVPIGYLFLAEPPVENIPIPDFRTVAGREMGRPSPDLLDTIYACQERQAWFRDFARVSALDPLLFVGSATLNSDIETVAADMRDRLGFDVQERAAARTWEEALRQFIQQADDAGVMVMVSGIVLSNTSRKLDVEEFRGFALSDPLAPLVFINGADTKAAQMFTLAHELAHLWLGATALSNQSARPSRGSRSEETWCNAVAAEFLAPAAAVRAALQPGEALDETKSRLARTFKVSTLVVLRRLKDVEHIDDAAFQAAWRLESTMLQERARQTSGGGDFYRATVSRVSRRFTKAVVSSALEGQTLYRDAFRMLGVRKTETFNTLGRTVGVME